MGYTTEFRGVFDLIPKLNPTQVAYLNKFAETRRMKRNVLLASVISDPIRLAVNLPIGDDAEYFVGASGCMGQNFDDISIVESSRPPATQPNLWCKWIPSVVGDSLEWNTIEKFYDYVEWLEYIITHFLKPWGIVANGSVRWRGEDFDDMGVITVNNNVVSSKEVTF